MAVAGDGEMNCGCGRELCRLGAGLQALSYFLISRFFSHTSDKGISHIPRRSFGWCSCQFSSKMLRVENDELEARIMQMKTIANSTYRVANLCVDDQS